MNLERVSVFLACIAGIALAILLQRGCEKVLTPSPAEITCDSRCKPNRGLVQNDKCFCSSDWREAP